MTADVQASLRKLHSLSQDLNEASDTLTTELTSVEAALNKLKLGVSAWVTIRKEDAGEGFTRAYTLGYYKLKGKWGLVVGELVEEVYDGGDDDVIFLRDAPRELRMEAAEHLAELIDELAKNAATTTEKATKRAAEVKEIASALSKGRN
jgi:hypothetical protein